MKKIATLATLILFWTILNINLVNATPHVLSPDPAMVSWYVTDIGGAPVDDAELKIHWANSPDGPFTVMPHDTPDGTYVYDKIADKRQNPIFSGYWNPDYPNGMAVCDIHPKEGLAGLYFYAKIEYDSVEEYWPTATSYKPGDPTWEPVVASGSPSGYAAAGPGIGTGPTTAYPTERRPPHVIPEVPLGTIVASAAMIIALVGYFVIPKFRKKQISINP